MNIYVSGRLDDPMPADIMSLVDAYGHTIAFDWTQHVPGKTMTHQELAEAERQGVWDADALLVCWVVDGGVGCWLEVGLALSHNIPVYLFGDCRESLFWHLPEVHRLPDLDSLCDWLS